MLLNFRLSPGEVLGDAPGGKAILTMVVIEANLVCLLRVHLWPVLLRVTASSTIIFRSLLILSLCLRQLLLMNW